MSLFLVVEDEKFLAKALEHKLISRGHVVLLANNGQQALDLLRDNHPDAILLDLIMPDMNGFEVLKTLGERHVHIPIIVSSNLTQREDKARALSLGAVTFISKADTSLQDIVDQLEKIALTTASPASPSQPATSASTTGISSTPNARQTTTVITEDL